MAKSKASTAVKQRKRRAATAGLIYVNDFDSGISRKKWGRGFTYVSSNGKTVKAKRTRDRIESLVIPPAWTEVWICLKANGHIQARGRDEAGRRQYVYHPDWTTISASRKFDRMHLFAELLPRIRRRVRKDISRKKLSRERVVAAVVRVIDKAQVRVGNERYAETNDSRGATTLDSDHVDVRGFEVSLDFPGKSGQRQGTEFRDQKVAKVVKRCEEIDAQYLFCYLDKDGEEQPVSSSDVNEYLKSVSKEQITAKDFRTWWGSVIALAELQDMEAELSKTARKKRAVAAVKVAAEELGNTPTVCRNSYIHPGILAAAESGELSTLLEKVDDSADSIAELTVDETRFANLLPHLEFS